MDDLELQAYFDDELDPDRRAEIAAQLAKSPQDRQRLEKLAALRSRLQALPRLAPAELEARVRNRMSRATRRPSRLRVSMLVGVTGLAAAVMLFIGGRKWIAPSQDDREIRLMVDDHLEPMPKMGTLESGSPRRLEEWLAPQLAFTPKLPHWSWATPVSGRLCWIGKKKLARIRYRYRSEEFSLFVYPERRPSHTEAYDVNHCRAVHWSRDGLGYVVVMPRTTAEQIPDLDG